MKRALKIMFIPIVGVTALAIIFLLVVWSANWYGAVMNDQGRYDTSAKDIGGYAIVAPTPQCDDSYFPVCGMDGITYDNACKAVRAQTQVAHRGGCQA